jgi:hypothetical protein
MSLAHFAFALLVLVCLGTRRLLFLLLIIAEDFRENFCFRGV